MNIRSLYTASILFWFSLAFQPSYAQPGRFIPSGVRVGTDLPYFGYQAFSQNLKPWELTADIDIHKFFLVADYGRVSYTANENYHNYNSQGSYMRIGADFNFLNQDTTHSVFYFGFRLANGGLNESTQFSTNNGVEINSGWPTEEIEINTTGIRTSWVEFVTGMRIRIIQEIYMGFTVRYKLSPRYRGNETLRPYYLPGYGKNIDESTWGFNYYIYYRIPFRKKVFPGAGDLED
ncbi:MAG: DUF6048 family protein [Cyclobacteriaceae bacterium]